MKRRLAWILGCIVVLGALTVTAALAATVTLPKVQAAASQEPLQVKAFSASHLPVVAAASVGKEHSGYVKETFKEGHSGRCFGVSKATANESPAY